MTRISANGGPEPSNAPVRCSSHSRLHSVASKLQTDLPGESSEPVLRRNLAKRSGIDIERGIPGVRVIEEIRRVDANGETLGFCKLKLFHQIRIHVPATRTIDGFQPKAAQLPGFCILQDKPPFAVGDRGVLAEILKNLGDAGAGGIRHPLVLLIAKVITEYIGPRQVTLTRKRPDDVGRAVRVYRI